MPRRLTLPLLCAFVLATSACSVRETTTPRTATEVLLLSTAAQRAIARYDVGPLAGKRVAIDASRYDEVDKPYVLSALRTQLVAKGGKLVKDLRGKKKDAPAPEAILELRNATFGIFDSDYGFGIPSVPMSTGPNSEPVDLPGFFLVKRGSQQGFCKLQLYAYEVASGEPIQVTHDLWGHAYYNEWWVLGFGPIVGNQDIYPESVE